MSNSCWGNPRKFSEVRLKSKLANNIKIALHEWYPCFCSCVLWNPISSETIFWCFHEQKIFKLHLRIASEQRHQFYSISLGRTEVNIIIKYQWVFATEWNFLSASQPDFVPWKSMLAATLTVVCAILHERFSKTSWIVLRLCSSVSSSQIS